MGSIIEYQKLQEMLEAMKSELKGVLEKNVAQLSDEKLSRDAMSQMLLDVAMKIQGSDVNTMNALIVETAPKPAPQPKEAKTGK